MKRQYIVLLPFCAMEYNNLAFTENGAISLASTNDPRVNLFFKTTREVGVLGDIEEGSMGLNRDLFDMIDAGMQSYPLDTMKILMNWRDCRGGKGDYRGFIVAMTYIHQKYPEWLLENYTVIPTYGSFLDLVKLWHYVNKDFQFDLVYHFMEVLCDDKMKMQNNEPISLLAKWLPSENSKWDKLPTGSAGSLYKTLCKFMSQRSDAERRAHIRKEYLSPLRKHLKLVESKMCANEFDKIEYSSVPSVAMHKYKKAFRRNDKERFQEFLTKVASGEAKINASQLYPHDLVRQYLASTKEDPVIEAQWKVIKEKAQQTGAFNDSIVVCDVSGSMEGTPMEVAIALGLLGLFENTLITFSEEPAIHRVPEGSLYEQVKNVRHMKWGCNTNFERVMDLVLGLSFRDPSKAIKRIYIFSDMQFDAAMGGRNLDTHFVNVQQRFASAQLEMPQIVFWNLRGETKDFPVTFDQKGVVLMAGYSPSLLNSLLDGKEITPLSIVQNIINSPRYDLIKEPTPYFHSTE